MKLNSNKKKEKTTSPQLKNVAGNSILLFVRVLILAIINLYAVRLMVKALGKDDYGLYNALAGVVTLSVIFITLFALPIQRFYSYSIGKGDKDSIKVYFSASINMLLGLSLLLLIIFETIGIYFVAHEMTIPIERMHEALIAFQLSIITFLLSLLQVPFLAMILANEDMGTYAFVSCIECLLKLLCAYLIVYSHIDKLIFYSICLLFVAISTFLAYFVICKFKYKECSYCKIKNSAIYKKIISFIGWTSLGSLSGVGLIQGSIIMLNIFFGPKANAAFGISNNIYNALMSLGNSAIVAFRPAIIKSYAANDTKLLDKLFRIGNIFLVYLLLSIAIPLGTEMEQILIWWLGACDKETVTFCRLFLVYGIIICMGAPISNIVQASGKVKVYYVACELIILLHLPIAYILFSVGLPAHYIYISMISVCAISHIIRVAFLRLYNHDFSQASYYLTFFTPAMLVAIIGLFISLTIHEIIETPLIRSVIVLLTTPFIILVFAASLGTKDEERHYIKQIISKFLKR